MTAVPLVAIVFFAALLQTASGFGFALIVMPLLTLLLGVQAAAPLVALLGLALYGINLLRYRQGLLWQEVIRLGAAALVGVPIGVWLLSSLEERVVEAGLGLVLVLFGAYSLARPYGPQLDSSSWAYPAGFLAGCLGGAYNTPGPPVIVYGSLRQWPRDGFRSVLQALFLVSGVLVVIAHAVAGHLVAPIWNGFAVALPALLAGIVAGALLDQRLDPARFRRLVLAMMVVLGISLIL